MKRKIFAAVLCLTLLVSSIGVSAASRETNFGYGGSYAMAYLNTYYGYGVAQTEPISSSYSTIGARIRFYGIAEVRNWAYGSWNSSTGRWEAVQYPADLDGVYMAESFHQIDAISTYLTAEYY